jgi:ankyrin repeat protein
VTLTLSVDFVPVLTDIVDDFGMTPLVVAIYEGREENAQQIVKFALDNGVVLNLQGHNNQTIEQLCVAHNVHLVLIHLKSFINKSRNLSVIRKPLSSKYLNHITIY